MTRKQEINAIYDRLCWMLKGVCQSNVDPDTVWEVISFSELSAFINAVNDCWQLQDAASALGSNLMNSCYIEKWRDFEELAETIYDGGGRINKPMTQKGAK